MNKRVSFSIPEERLSYYKEHAKEKFYSLSSLIIRALDKYCTNYPLCREKKERQINIKANNNFINSKPILNVIKPGKDKFMIYLIYDEIYKRYKVGKSINIKKRLKSISQMIENLEVLNKKEHDRMNALKRKKIGNKWI